MYLLINKTNFKTKQATPTIQKRFWRALTTYNNHIPSSTEAASPPVPSGHVSLACVKTCGHVKHYWTVRKLLIANYDLTKRTHILI